MRMLYENTSIRDLCKHTQNTLVPQILLAQMCDDPTIGTALACGCSQCTSWVLRGQRESTLDQDFCLFISSGGEKEAQQEIQPRKAVQPAKKKYGELVWGLVLYE